VAAIGGVIAAALVDSAGVASTAVIAISNAVAAQSVFKRVAKPHFGQIRTALQAHMSFIN